MYRYEVIISWTATDDAFVADLPDLPGCMVMATATARLLSRPKRLSAYGSIPRKSPAIQYLSPRAIDFRSREVARSLPAPGCRELYVFHWDVESACDRSGLVWCHSVCRSMPARRAAASQ